MAVENSLSLVKIFHGKNCVEQGENGVFGSWLRNTHLYRELPQWVDSRDIHGYLWRLAVGSWAPRRRHHLASRTGRNLRCWAPPKTPRSRVMQSNGARVKNLGQKAPGDTYHNFSFFLNVASDFITWLFLLNFLFLLSFVNLKNFFFL